MAAVIALLILGFLPMLGALGWDAYQFYENMDEGFRLSDLGHLLTQQFPNEFRWMVQTIGDFDQELWQFISSNILTQKSVMIGAIFGVIWAIPVGIYVAIRLVKEKAMIARAASGEYQYNREN